MRHAGSGAKLQRSLSSSELLEPISPKGTSTSDASHPFGVNGGLTRRSHSSPNLPNLVPQTAAASGDLGAYLGVDIGGTLTKAVFLERPGKTLGSKLRKFVMSRTKYSVGERDQQLSVNVQGGRLHFGFFPSAKIETALKRIRNYGFQDDIKTVYTTGGGAHKHVRLIQEELGIELLAADELETVVRGISWLAEHVEGEVYIIEGGKNVPLEVVINGTSAPLVSLPSTDVHTSPNGTAHRAASMVPLFPLLIVNIGTGVSIVKVQSSHEFERVSGTALGGGTYWGLCQLLTGCKDFETAAKLASGGDAGEVNLEVRDIYGGDYNLPNGSKLPGSMTASFFAKSATAPGTASQGGVLRALVTMIAQNVCQIAILNMRIYDVRHVVFTGNFLRQNPVAISTISTNFERVAEVALKSQGGTRPCALFLRHEGYFGALGSFLLNWETHIGGSDDHHGRLPKGGAQSQRLPEADRMPRPAVPVPHGAGGTRRRQLCVPRAFWAGCASGAFAVVAVSAIWRLWQALLGRRQKFGRLLRLLARFFHIEAAVARLPR